MQKSCDFKPPLKKNNSKDEAGSSDQKNADTKRTKHDKEKCPSTRIDRV